MVFVFLVFCVQLSCYQFVQDKRLLEVSQPIDGAAIDDLAALVGRLASVNCHLLVFLSVAYFSHFAQLFSHQSAT